MYTVFSSKMTLRPAYHNSINETLSHRVINIINGVLLIRLLHIPLISCFDILISLIWNLRKKTSQRRRYAWEEVISDGTICEEKWSSFTFIERKYCSMGGKDILHIVWWPDDRIFCLKYQLLEKLWTSLLIQNIHLSSRFTLGSWYIFYDVNV